MANTAKENIVLKRVYQGAQHFIELPWKDKADILSNLIWYNRKQWTQKHVMKLLPTGSLIHWPFHSKFIGCSLSIHLAIKTFLSSFVLLKLQNPRNVYISHGSAMEGHYPHEMILGYEVCHMKGTVENTSMNPKYFIRMYCILPAYC